MPLRVRSREEKDRQAAAARERRVKKKAEDPDWQKREALGVRVIFCCCTKCMNTLNNI